MVTITRPPRAQSNTPPTAPVGRVAGRRRLQRREDRAGYIFLSPWLIGLVVFTAGPMLASLYLAFTEYNLFDAPQWVGWANFSRMFEDPRWWQAVRVTLLYVLIGTPIKLIASLAVAMLLNVQRKGVGVFRSAFYAPSLIGGSIAIAITWKLVFSNNGAVDQLQRLVGIDIGGWVGNPAMSLPLLMGLAAWQFGAPMVIFLAGLKQIPAELYEAAAMDGAGFWIRLRSVTLPLFFLVFQRYLVQGIATSGLKG